MFFYLTNNGLIDLLAIFGAIFYITSTRPEVSTAIEAL